MLDFVRSFFMMDELHDHVHVAAMSYDGSLVLLSIAVAVLASFTAFHLITQVRAAPTKTARDAWLVTGSVAMGCGIWTMHFIGMLALDMDMEVRYGITLTALSLVFAIIASGFAFVFVDRGVKGWHGFLVGGLFLGAGIGAMHYTGMAAMSMPAHIHYDPLIFLLSIVVAVTLSAVALGLLHTRLVGHRRAPFAKMLGSAIVMGLSISAMHYTGMAATHFTPDPNLHPSGVNLDSSFIVVVIIAIVVMVMGSTLLASLINNRMRAKDLELQVSEKLLRAIIESTHSAIVTIDGAGAVLSFNPAAEKMFRRRAAETVGRSAQDLMLADERQKIEDYIARPVMPRPDESPLMQWEGEGLRADGSTFPADFTLQKMECAERPSFLLVCRNIAARKQREAERERFELELRQAHKMESLGVLAGGIAHEINSPMQFINDNMSFLRDGVAELAAFLQKQKALVASPQKREEPAETLQALSRLFEESDCDYYIEEMPKSIEETFEGIGRIREIVHAVQQFSHPGETEKREANINELIATTITVCRNQWKYVAEVETDFDEDLPPLVCLPGELNQVFLNLIVNAAHAIEEKGAEQTGAIRISTRHLQDWIEVRVQDSGGGVSRELRDKIFDLFFTTKPPGKGTGQGLAISYSIVHQKHGGTIAVEGAEGEGATFVVRLPLKQSGTAEAVEIAA